MPAPTPLASASATPKPSGLTTILHEELINYWPWKYFLFCIISMVLVAVTIYVYRVCKDQLIKSWRNKPPEKITIGSFSMAEKSELKQMQEEQSESIEALNQKIDILEEQLIERKNQEKEILTGVLALFDETALRFYEANPRNKKSFYEYFDQFLEDVEKRQQEISLEREQEELQDQ